MLLAEQYLMIYLLAIFLVKNDSVKILATFLTFDFILDSILYYFLSFSPLEYIIIKTLVEVGSLLLILQFIKCFKLRNLFILCYIPTLLSPLFLLSLDHWITRNDLLSQILFIVCTDVAKYSNELFLTYIVYTNNDKSIKTNFWQIFIACNYLSILLR